MQASGKMMRSVEGVRDVALVPERDVLQRGRRVAADHAGQAADALALLGVALVRHRGGAGLAGQEGLLGLAQLGALHVADLHRELLQRGRDQRQGRDELRVPVALEDLIRYRRDRQAESRADALLGRGGDRGMRPDGAADLAHADRGRGRRQAGAAAPAPRRPRGRAAARRSSARRGCRACGPPSACACARALSRPGPPRAAPVPSATAPPHRAVAATSPCPRHRSR